MMMHSLEFPFLFFGFLGAVIFVLVPVAQIIHKAGYSRLWILAWFVPLLNVIMLWVFAFSRWPVEDRGMAGK